MKEPEETKKPKSKPKAAGKKVVKSKKKAAPKTKATTRKGAAKKPTVKKTAGKKVVAKPGLPPGTTMTEALGETFLMDLITDWHEHGGGVIENCRATKPDAYLKLVATYAPKEFRKTLEPFEGMSDRDLQIRFKEALEEIRTIGLDEGA